MIIKASLCGRMLNVGLAAIVAGMLSGCQVQYKSAESADAYERKHLDPINQLEEETKYQAAVEEARRREKEDPMYKTVQEKIKYFKKHLSRKDDMDSREEMP